MQILQYLNQRPIDHNNVAITYPDTSVDTAHRTPKVSIILPNIVPVLTATLTESTENPLSTQIVILPGHLTTLGDAIEHFVVVGHNGNLREVSPKRHDLEFPKTIVKRSYVSSSYSTSRRRVKEIVWNSRIMKLASTTIAEL